ncbi:aspartic peptidase domain-containing protein [Xylariaceae sp. FL0255]|nr:aspartic peptidase domain-containing protein [Xylariaceae sp. FL0255]
MAPSTFSLPRALLAYLSVASVVKASSSFLEATWSTSFFGPDGPWPALEITVGSGQQIALYPGREFQTFVLTTDYCSLNSSIACTATQAGTYNEAESEVDNTGSTGEIQYAPTPNFMAGVNIQGEDAESWIDYMEIGGTTIPNVSMALISDAFAVYPDQTWYPLSVGCMGIGAPKTVNQSFSTGDGPAINASLIPGILNALDEIPSNSFSMHIGSQSPSIGGSFYFGGYDQNRVVGEVLNETDDYTKAISLKDISISVIDGSSPFNFTGTQSGLLAAGNSTISSAGIQISLDGCSPYLSLPPSTCEAIASYLPVTKNKELGLYTWNTDSAKYSQIVSSASALQFTFAAGSNKENITISVPFPHLNLTLSSPLVTTNTQYFPCYTGSEGSYVLGRAFLQDAFVGANWGSNVWWLAQAPGPNVPSPNVITIDSSATTIQTSSNDWATSWQGSWKALTPDEVAPSSTVQPSSNNGTSSSTSSSGLSTGAKAGIGVGVAVAALAVLGLLAFFLIRRRRQPSEEVKPAASETSQPAQAAQHAGYPNSAQQHGYYEPVKTPGTVGSPSMSEAYARTASTDPSMYNQQYSQQYGQQYPPQQYAGHYAPYAQQQGYAAELPAVGNTPTELPASYGHQHPSNMSEIGSPESQTIPPHLNHDLPQQPHPES